MILIFFKMEIYFYFIELFVLSHTKNNWRITDFRLLAGTWCIWRIEQHYLIDSCPFLGIFYMFQFEKKNKKFQKLANVRLLGVRLTFSNGGNWQSCSPNDVTRANFGNAVWFLKLWTKKTVNVKEQSSV